MSNQIVISSGAKVRSLNGVITGTTGVLDSLPINASNGIPQLDVNGKILVSQLPNSVMEYQGTWNANTNTPTLTNGGAFNQGDVYLCNVAGTTDFGAGPIAFVVGDQVIYSGSIWQKASGASGTVTSVAVTESGDALTITGSPITTSGTINIGFAGISAQYVAGNGALVTFPTLISSIGLSMPSAFSVANSPLTANGTIAVTGAGFASQYIRGDGTLADFPTSGGGGSSVSYYLNGGTSQGVIGGVTYYEMSKTADTGTGVDFPKTGDGLIVSFLTDANDPAQLNIPGGNWNYEIYVSMSANGGTPQLYAELYKYDGTTFTLISTSSNEILYDGTTLNMYTFAMAVPTTTLTVTDRLAVKLYATNSGGKTTTVHTQNGHLCQVITTFSTGITALNGLTAQVQYLQVGTSGTDFNISSSTATHTFNLPTASATNRGALASADWTTFNNKQSTLSLTTTGNSGSATLVSNTLNVPTYTLAGLGGISLTSLSATTPLSYNNTTGAFSIQVANTSQDGYLSSTDWNTFNGKQNTITNPVTGTGTSGQVTYFNGTSSVTSSSNFKFDGTNLTIGNPSSALAQLHIYNASAAASFLLQTNSTTDYSEIAVRNNSSTATSYFRQYSTAATGSDFGISRAGLALFFSNYATNFAIGTRNGGDLILGTADTERARITSTGLLGLGTNNPYSLLDLTSSAPKITLTVSSYGGSYRTLLGVRTGAEGVLQFGNNGPNYIVGGNSAAGGQLLFYVNASSDFVTSTNGTLALTLASTGAATFSSSVTTNGYINNYLDQGALRLYNSSTAFAGGIGTGAWVEGSATTDIAIYSANNLKIYTGSSSTAKVTIASTGNVGIGTSSPKTILQINAGTGAYPTLGTNVTNAFFVGRNDGLVGMYLGYAADGNGWIQQMRNDYATAYNLILQPSGGNVLIGGTSAPQGYTNYNLALVGSYAMIKLQSPSHAWDIYNNLGTSLIFAFDSTDKANINQTTGVYTALSDINKKKDFEDSTIGLNAILGLKPTLYRMKDEEGSEKHLGFIAQEIKEFIPQAYVQTKGQKEDFIGLDYQAITATLVKAVQELSAEIEELKLKIK